MNDPNMLEVIRVEHHLWRTCPCEHCKAERERREPPSDSPLRSMSVEAALVLGLIPSRCPEGSLAARIAAERRIDDRGSEQEGPSESP